jgi:hypothetical protein
MYVGEATLSWAGIRLFELEPPETLTIGPMVQLPVSSKQPTNLSWFASRASFDVLFAQSRHESLYSVGIVAQLLIFLWRNLNETLLLDAVPNNNLIANPTPSMKLCCV